MLMGSEERKWVDTRKIKTSMTLSSIRMVSNL